MLPKLPSGFRLAGVHSGIKQASDTEDISLIVSDVPALAVGVYTRNLFRAAPVLLDESRTPSSSIRAIISNSGNANACTGERGEADAFAVRPDRLVRERGELAAYGGDLRKRGHRQHR